MAMVEQTPLTDEQRRRLARIHNRGSMYELIAEHRDGRRVRAGYCHAKNWRGLWQMLVKHADFWVGFTGDKEIERGGEGRDPRGKMGEWTFRFSGRTERDCIMEGELPFEPLAREVAK